MELASCHHKELGAGLLIRQRHLHQPPLLAKYSGQAAKLGAEISPLTVISPGWEEPGLRIKMSANIPLNGSPRISKACPSRREIQKGRKNSVSSGRQGSTCAGNVAHGQRHVFVALAY